VLVSPLKRQERTGRQGKTDVRKEQIAVPDDTAGTSGRWPYLVNPATVVAPGCRLHFSESKGNIR